VAMRTEVAEIADWIAHWLGSHPPGVVDEILASGDLAGWLLREWGGLLGPFRALAPSLARAAIGPRLMDVIRTLGPEDYREILDRLLISVPEHGLRLMAVEDWFLAELDRLRTMLLEG
jgi:hypothetical protein